MTTVYDVPATPLIDLLAVKLKKEFKPPEFARFAKTGVGKEKSPTQADWWYKRAAALLRKIYLHHEMGVRRLSTKFSSAQNRKTKTYRVKSSSRAIIRKALHQLEEVGYVEKTKKGRKISPNGKSLLDNTAHEVMQKLIKEKPSLGKY